MRPLSLLSVLLVCVGCTIVPPRALPGVTVSVRVAARAETRAAAPAPPRIVAVVNAPVVEFFGIPLDDAQDVVFVLDCSGSMNDRVSGRLAQLDLAPAPPPPAPAEAPPPAPDPYAPGPAPDPHAPAPDPYGPSPAPDPYAPAPDPYAPAPDPYAPSPAPDPYAPAPAPDPYAPAPPPAAPAAPAAPTAPQWPRKIDVAQAELVDALRRLPAGTRMNLVFFNNGLEAVSPGMVSLDEPGREALIGFVLDRVPIGSTALAPAMRTALLMNARRIVLLSDGLGNVGGNARALLRDAREAIRGGIRIDTIGLGRDQDVSLLHALAVESGGLYQAL